MTGKQEVRREFGSVPFRGSAAVRDGVVTRGVLRGRQWRRLLPDVYVHADGFDPDDHRMWCRAVGITLGKGSAVDRYSAAFLWGVDLLSSRRIVSVTVPRAERPRSHPWRRVTRTDLADPDIEHLDGVPVTTPRRTAFDLGRQPGRQAAMIALDGMCHLHLARPAELGDYTDRHRRRWGARRLGERLSLVEPLTESPMETVLRMLLYDARLPPPMAQVTVWRDGRFVARVDLAYPDSRVAVEYEGDHHRERRQFRRDVARLNALREAGWVVLRFTADDVLRRPADVVRQVSDALRPESTHKVAQTGRELALPAERVRNAGSGTVRAAPGPGSGGSRAHLRRLPFPPESAFKKALPEPLAGIDRR